MKHTRVASTCDFHCARATGPVTGNDTAGDRAVERRVERTEPNYLRAEKRRRATYNHCIQHTGTGMGVGAGSLKILTGVLVHRVTRPLRGSVSCGSGQFGMRSRVSFLADLLAKRKPIGTYPG